MDNYETVAGCMSVMSVTSHHLKDPQWTPQSTSQIRDRDDRC